MSANSLVGRWLLASSLACAAVTTVTAVDMDLYLELVVNGVASGRVVRVAQEGEHFVVNGADLAPVPLPSEIRSRERVVLDAIAGVTVQYDSHRQRLEVSVPASWLPSQSLNATQNRPFVPVISTGALFNYELFASSPTGAGASLSAWTEARLFGRRGSVSSTGVVRRMPGATRPEVGGGGFLRYDTSWTQTDEARMITYTAGDLSTGALSWNNAVRMGGFTIARNFRARPDVVTYPLPEFAGQAALPTTVELFVNGTRVTGGDVAPGPFTINQQPFVNGAGTATIVTTDALGRQASSTLSFYVANSLLQRGLADFSVSAGLLRQQFALRSFDYGAPMLTVSGRRGLTNSLTLEGHGEAAGRLGLGGVGATMAAWRFGVVSFSGVASRHDAAAGRQGAIGYAYTAARFNVNLQRLVRSAGFADVTQLGPLAGRSRLTRRIDQITGAVNLGRRAGTIGLGVFSIENGPAQSTGLVNVSYSRPLREQLSLYTSLNHDRGRGFSAQAQLTLGLGPRGNASLVASSDGNGAATRMQYSRSMPTDGGVGFNVGYASGNGDYRQVDLSWRTPYAVVSGGVYGSGGRATRWASGSGSAIVMDGSVFPANRVSDSFVLVDTDGHAGVPVLFENQRVGQTDRRGHLLVPSVNAYYPAKYQIDAMAIGQELRVDTVEQQVAVRSRSGAIVRFPIAAVTSLLIQLVDASGVPLALGRLVTNTATGEAAVVGWDGLTYLDVREGRVRLRVTGGEAAPCEAVADVPRQFASLERLGPLPCR